MSDITTTTTQPPRRIFLLALDAAIAGFALISIVAEIIGTI